MVAKVDQEVEVAEEISADDGVFDISDGEYPGEGTSETNVEG